MAKELPKEFEIRDCLVAVDDAHELRAADPLVDQPGFDGYVSTWWTVDDRGTFFIPGSFKKTFKERAKNAPVLWQHDYYNGVPIGKHLEAVEDEKGAKVRVAINEGVQRGAEVMSSFRFGTPIGLSFGFDRIQDRSATDKDPLDLSVAPDWIKSLPRNELRGIIETRFWETSPVVFGSNARAGATKVRSLDDLPALLNAIRDGSLSEEERSRLEQIVAAWEERAAAGENHGTQEDPARPRFDVYAALARAAELGVAA